MKKSLISSQRHSVTASLLFTLMFTLLTGALNGQEAYNPCAESSVATPSCTNGSRLCYSYSQFPCSPGYCWSGGGITNNAGIPFNGIVSNKTIDIGGVYTVTQNVKFIDCTFKMRGDARIDLIPTGNVLMKVSFENCQFFGCDEMWQGIHINAAGATGGLQFVFSNNHVEDAYIGLLLDEVNGAYSIFGNVFNNNHIGISNLRQSNLPLNAGFVQNTFAQTLNLANRSGSLAPPFPMPDYPLAHAGIKMIRTTASIGIATSANLFTCLFNGIISDQATTLSMNNTFQNIGHYGIWAIDGTLSAQRCRFLQTGFKGIWTTGANLTATFNVFNGDWIEGIHSEQNLNAEQIVIDDNVFAIAFDNWTLGIFLERPQSSIGVNATINDNDFIINAEPVGMVCINLKDFVNAKGNTEISLNTMNISNVLGGTTGIIAEVGQSDHLLISDNTIDFTQIATMFDCWGIAIMEYGTPGPSAPQLHRIEGNTITCVPANFANGDYAAQCAFHVSKLTDATFCENTVDETLWGFHFTNKCNIDLVENNIHNHDIGVFIVDQIGPQFGHGNQWDLDPNACFTWAIQTLNSTNPYTSEFIVPEGGTLPHFPPLNRIDPDPIVDPWFTNTSHALNYCDQFAQPEVDEFNEEEQSILNNTSDLTGTERWDAQLSLYTRLLFSPELRPGGSAAETFFNAMQADNIAELASVQQQINAALVVSEELQLTLDSFRSAINLLFETIVPLDTTVDFSLVDDLSENWLWERGELLSEISSLANMEQSLEFERSEFIMLALTEVLAANDAIAPLNILASSQKTVQDFQIRKLLGESMTQVRYEQAMDLAQQDRAVVGNASAEIVNYLALCHQRVIWEAEDQLEERSINQKMPVKKGNLLVFPNPTNGAIQVQLSQQEGGVLRVFNAQGQSLKTISFESGTNSLNLSLEGHPIGQYWFVLQDVSGRITNRTQISLVK